MAHVETALDALTESCYYLSMDRARYRFTLSPNLNKLLVDRRSAVDPHEMETRVRETIREVFKAGTTWAERIPFPAASNDVPDRPALALVVLGPEQGYLEPAKQEARAFVDRIMREHGASSRTYKSALFFAVADSSASLYDEAKKMLAWEEIANDDDIRSRLDDAQLRQVDASTKKAKRDLQDAIWRAYKWVLFLGKDNAIKEMDLGLIHSSADNSLGELIRNRLTQVDELTDGVGANTLLRNWPPFKEWTTKAVRDAFYASPALRRLLDPNAIKRTIAQGVTGGVLGYAAKDSEGRLTNVHVDVPLEPQDVLLTDDMVILKAADARALVEPPHVARIEIKAPDQALQPGQQYTFTAVCYDQHGSVIEGQLLTWRASVGQVDEGGRYVAEAGATYRTIEASVDGVTASLQVPVLTHGGSGTDSGANSGGTDTGKGPGPSAPLHWEATVPWNKYTQLASKVLTKFASTPGLTITVRFDVPAEGATEEKVQQVRAALRELGLPDDL